MGGRLNAIIHKPVILFFQWIKRRSEFTNSKWGKEDRTRDLLIKKISYKIVFLESRGANPCGN